MIFVTVGTVSYPFPRLISTIKDFSDASSEKIIVQIGNNPLFSSNSRLTFIKFMSASTIKRYYSAADLIISATGEGSVFQILKLAKNKPIFFPRQKQYGEHVDDQQVKIARIIKHKHLAWVAFTSGQLVKFLNRGKRVRNNSVRFSPENRSLILKNLDAITCTR